MNHQLHWAEICFWWCSCPCMAHVPTNGSDWLTGSLSQTQVESLHWFVIGALCRVIRCSFMCPQEKSHNNTHIELIIHWKNQPSNRKVVKGKEFQKKKWMQMACRAHLYLWTKCAMFCEKLITEMVKCWESVHKSRLQRPFPHRETGYTETRRQGHRERAGTLLTLWEETGLPKWTIPKGKI